MNGYAAKLTAPNLSIIIQKANCPHSRASVCAKPRHNRDFVIGKLLMKRMVFSQYVKSDCVLPCRQNILSPAAFLFQIFICYRRKIRSFWVSNKLNTLSLSLIIRNFSGFCFLSLLFCLFSCVVKKSITPYSVVS